MPSSKIAIYSALVANFLIAVTKFIAAIITRSSAMMSEGIHSVVDTSNEILLLYGIKQSKKKPDEKRPFGYGKELYFWSFVVSIMIFGIGAGISFYEGVTHLQHPHTIENPSWNYVVLGIALLFDGVSFIIALKNFNRQRGEQPFWSAVKKSRDPSSFVILFEDAADVLGLIVAFLGVYLGHLYNNPYFDGWASIIIGLILTAVSLVLTRESKSLLMGETISSHTIENVQSIARANPAVENIRSLQSMVLSPEEVLLVLKITVRKNLSAAEVVEAVQDIRRSIHAAYSHFKQVYIEVD